MNLKEQQLWQKWMKASDKLYEAEKATEEKEEDFSNMSAFDCLEKIRNITNDTLKDPDDEKEIEKILTRVKTVVDGFLGDEEEEEKPEEKPETPPQTPPVPTSTNSGQDQIGNQDLGQNLPTNSANAIGGNLAATPASGGQM